MSKRVDIVETCLLWLGVALVVVASIGIARADHFAGADLTWTCNGPHAYTIHLNIYRDCSGAAWGWNTILYRDLCTASNGAWEGHNLTLTDVVDITPACPSAPTTCEGGTTYGIQRYTYTGTLTRPPSCGPVSLAWTQCCRNLVSNLNYPLNDSQSYVYIEALAPSPCTPSPLWTSPANPVICRQTPQTYDHSTYGVAQVTYTNRIVYCGVGVWPCTYAGGSNWTSPTGTWNLNPTSGVINWSNNAQGLYQFAIRASWPGGFTERDHQVRVIACNNDPPTLQLPALLNPCPGQTIATGITATDVDGPALTFGPTTWTAPTEPGIYYITAYANDGACPIEGVAYGTIPVYVICTPMAIPPWMVPDTIMLDPQADEVWPWRRRYNLIGQQK